jgi:chemosensory pili system protein ChpA (sensor histidine kinase/response regulator)
VGPRNAYEPWFFGPHGSPVAIGLHRQERVPKRVLVVDDMPYLRDVQVMLLTEAGYCATALGNAREALDRLAELAPDLILLDMSMPEMDGRQFLARLRATPRWQGLPVILTTGKAVDGVARDNDCEVLGKPFSDVALLDRVQRLIGAAGSNGS